jgi:hypothetical protein
MSSNESNDNHNINNNDDDNNNNNNNDDNDIDEDFEMISGEFESVDDEPDEHTSSLLTLNDRDLNDIAFGAAPVRRVVHIVRVRADEPLNINVTQQYCYALPQPNY